MNFNEFLAEVPDCNGPARFPLRRTGADLDYARSGLAAFVAPDLSVRPDASSSRNPSVIIISAAGAVGKSTVARQLAHKKNTLLWDLAQSQPVGQSSLSGTLLSVFGAGQISDIDKALRSGDLFVVIDALDEARVKTTEAGFNAFLDDLAEYAKATRGVTFVLFGRTHIADHTWLYLEINEVPANSVHTADIYSGTS